LKTLKERRGFRRRAYFLTKCTIPAAADKLAATSGFLPAALVKGTAVLQR